MSFKFLCSRCSDVFIIVCFWFPCDFSFVFIFIFPFWFYYYSFFFLFCFCFSCFVFILRFPTYTGILLDSHCFLLYWNCIRVVLGNKSVRGLTDWPELTCLIEFWLLIIYHYHVIRRRNITINDGLWLSTHFNSAFWWWYH